MLGLSLVAASGGRSSSRCAGLSLSWPLLLRSTGSRHAGSVIVAHGPSCSAAHGIFPDQGSNPCPLHWQADSQPLCHQGSPQFSVWQQVEFADSLHGHYPSTHPSHGNQAEHFHSIIPQAFKIREICNCPPLSGPHPRSLFKLSMKDFLEESEKEDLNITVKKQKIDTILIQETRSKYCYRV